MNIRDRIDRLADTIGHGKKPLVIVWVNNGETFDQAWERKNPGLPRPTGDHDAAMLYVGWVGAIANARSQSVS